MNHKLQEIAAEITRQRQKLLQVVGDLSQRQLDFQPAPESWSIGEVLHHLFLIEILITKMAGRLLQEAQQTGLQPDPDGESSALHSLDHLRETSQNKFKTISQTSPQAGMAKAELLTLLQRSRIGLLEVMGTATKYDLNQLAFPHPFLGELHLYQWFLFAGRHEQRHRQQIRGVLENSEFPSVEVISPNSRRRPKGRCRS